MKLLPLLLLCAAPLAADPLSVHLVTPCRWLDTRIPGCIPGSGNLCAQGAFHDQETRAYLIQASARCSTGEQPIPLGAKGLVANVTATGASNQGNLLLMDATKWDQPTPPSSFVSFRPGANSANLVMVPLGQEQGQVPGSQIQPDLSILARVAGGGTVHIVVDIVGYLE